ncbi:14-3-3 domain-containing protein [Mycena floridula]|nr:14-3-3 domain-containing protein [Mycena floridula]
MPPVEDGITRLQCSYLAGVMGEAERYTDVVNQIRYIVENFDPRLTIDERNLVSVAYKNRTNTLRSSWRVVQTLFEMESSRSAPAGRLALLRSQREKIERELADVCNDSVRLLEDHLLAAAQAGEEEVFYLKMRGDYYRYLAEFCQKREREKFAEESLQAYKLAYQKATNSLDPLHPTKLGLALNFAVFFHDVRKSPERACHLAKSAFDDAIAALSDTEASSVRDSLMILQLLRDDLILWSNEMTQNEATD